MTQAVSAAIFDVDGVLVASPHERAWREALPDNLQESATAEALQAIDDLDLDEVVAIEPPRGYGRD